MKLNKNSASFIVAIGLWFFLNPTLLADSPWRIGEALKLPDSVSLTGTHRIRFENLHHQFRVGKDGGDQVLAFRTLLKAEFEFDRVSLTAEVQDSRAELGDMDSSISTSIVNPIDLLQSYVTVPLGKPESEGIRQTLKVGRFTMDLGGRRLVERTGFGNVIRSFTGVHWERDSAHGNRLRAFFTSPVERRISDDVLDNSPKLDAELDNVRLAGFLYSSNFGSYGDIAEIYLISMDEVDSTDQRTANRDLNTFGGRIYRGSSPGNIDFQLESAIQVGHSRMSKSSEEDLDHLAHFHHFEVGFTFEGVNRPRIQLIYDFASGDEDPSDSENGQFTNLYGGRSSDFGPTSIYGPVARANLISPGLRFSSKPREDMSFLCEIRGYWRESSKDNWVKSGASDPSVFSGDHIGTQVRMRTRLDVVPKNVRVEVGGAFLLAGELMKSVNEENAVYVYVQSTFSF